MLHCHRPARLLLGPKPVREATTADYYVLLGQGKRSVSPVVSSTLLRTMLEVTSRKCSAIFRNDKRVAKKPARAEELRVPWLQY